MTAVATTTACRVTAWPGVEGRLLTAPYDVESLRKFLDSRATSELPAPLARMAASLLREYAAEVDAHLTQPLRAARPSGRCHD